MDWNNWIDVIQHMAIEADFVETLSRLLCAVALSAVVGLERQRKGRPAGIRTHILVCLGSALLMVVSEELAKEWGANGAPIWLDKGRIAAGIVTGVGFLGAGTIVNYGNDQHGLTTAAMIWFVAAIGIAVGSGMYMVGMLATAIAIVTVIGLDNSSGIPTKMYYTVRVTLKDKPQDMSDLVNRLNKHKGLRAKPVAICAESNTNECTVEIRISAKSDIYFNTIYKAAQKEFAEASKIELYH